jgi:hypothetical protein
LNTSQNQKKKAKQKDGKREEVARERSIEGENKKKQHNIINEV